MEIESKTLDFQKDVLAVSEKIPMVVDFWAEWCAPCRILGPVLEKLAGEAQDTWRLVKVNTEEHQQIAMQYQIQSIPAVKMFYGGEVIAEFVGALPEVQIRQWLDENLPTESKKILQQAKEALQDGDETRARDLLQQTIAMDAGNVEARVLLAETVFASDPKKAALLVQEVLPEDALFERADAIKTLANLMNRIDDIDKKAQEPNAPAWQHYAGGIHALHQRDFAKALQEWIETLSINRQIDDDGPRRACVALFTWLGQQHELTQKYHRAFTSALF